MAQPCALSSAPATGTTCIVQSPLTATARSTHPTSFLPLLDTRPVCISCRQCPSSACLLFSSFHGMAHFDLLTDAWHCMHANVNEHAQSAARFTRRHGPGLPAAGAGLMHSLFWGPPAGQLLAFSFLLSRVARLRLLFSAGGSYGSCMGTRDEAAGRGTCVRACLHSRRHWQRARRRAPHRLPPAC